MAQDDDNVAPGLPEIGEIHARVVDEMARTRDGAGRGLVTDEERAALLDAIRFTARPMHRSELDALIGTISQHLLVLTYFARHFRHMADRQKVVAEDKAAELYLALRGERNTPGVPKLAKPTEGSIDAAVRENESYRSQRAWHQKLAGFAQQLSGLLGVLEQRARMLEQLSNNVRLDRRLEEIGAA